MGSLFLSDDEIVELTRRRSRKAQGQALSVLGIVHRARPDGSLVVLRAHVEAALSDSSTTKARREPEPNWSAI